MDDQSGERCDDADLAVSLRRPRWSAVNLAGALTIGAGVFDLLIAIAAAIGGFTILGATGDILRNGAAAHPIILFLVGLALGLMVAASVFFFMLAIVVAMFGAVTMLAGMGVIRRSRGGYVGTLLLSGIRGVFALGFAVMIVATHMGSRTRPDASFAVAELGFLGAEIAYVAFCFGALIAKRAEFSFGGYCTTDT